jgi:predicted acyl esterase
MLLMDYPLRARYREGLDREVLLVPGEPAKLKWHLGWTSIILNQGHRLRVTISSTGAPLYEPNNQTGGPQTIDWLKDAVKATHTVLHEKQHASRVLLPVRP